MDISKLNLPWSVEVDEDGKTVLGIFDAKRNKIVETDSGFYPPNLQLAQLIVDCVNKYSVNEFG